MGLRTHASGILVGRMDLNVLMVSSEQSFMGEIEDQIGPRQVTRKDMESAPDWLIRREMKKEITENWYNITEEVGGDEFPNVENIQSSHFVFKIEKTEDVRRTLKERLRVPRNGDVAKVDVRKDAVEAEMMMNRLVIALGMIRKFKIGVADFKGAMMQSGPA